MPIIEFLGKRFKALMAVSNRWRGVETAGWAALLLAIVSVVLFNLATSGSTTENAFKSPVPTLLYPYLAAASVFVTTCVWILFSARLGVPPDQIAPDRFADARRWFWRVFTYGCATLLFAGLAGEPGANAVRSLNWYVFGPAEDPLQVQSFWIWLGFPFAGLAAFANALAFGTLTYLGVLCNALVLGVFSETPRLPGEVKAAALRVGSSIRRLKSYLLMASALMVTSTLTLYLLFGTAEQIQPLQTAHSDSPTSSAPAAKTEETSGQAVKMDCRLPAGERVRQTCNITLLAASTVKKSSSVAYMALVAGLSFSGVLFVLFTSCGAALDDRITELARVQNDRSTESGHDFDFKTWLEQAGLLSGGLEGQVMQALALVAPALTGLLTLLTA